MADFVLWLLDSIKANSNQIDNSLGYPETGVTKTHSFMLTECSFMLLHAPEMNILDRNLVDQDVNLPMRNVVNILISQEKEREVNLNLKRYFGLEERGVRVGGREK